MRALKYVLVGLLVVVLIAVVIIAVLFWPQIKTASSITKLSDYAGPYNLYEMDVAYDYDLDAVIDAGVRTDQGFVDAVLAQVLPGVPVSVQAPSFGCSAFRAQTPDGSYLMGRNYDFKQDTSAILVRTHPEGGYASIGFCALNNLGANEATAGVKARAAALLAPFATLDGVNEKGVSIAVLTLDSKPTEQDTGRACINTSLAIRLVLDRAATTQEAVELLASYDMHATSGRDYHFFITDATGDSRVVEYDPKDEARPMVVTPARQVTNYFALYADEVQPNQKNGIYGHGKERANAIAEVLDAAGDTAVTTDVAWDALQAAAQDPNPEDVTSNTQWSIVYDNTARTASFVLRRSWADVFNFSL